METTGRNYCTYREFGKMLRAVADLYSQMGDTPLCADGEEKTYIMERVGYIMPQNGFDECILPLREMWRTGAFDVARSRRWGEYVLKCRKEGIEPDFSYFSDDSR